MRHRFLAALSALILVSATLAGSNNSLMDITPDGKTMLVANPDNGTVTVIDLGKFEKVREIAVGDKPEGVTWIGNGPTAAVTVYREDKVVFVDTNVGAVVHSLAVADEPYGIVSNRAGTLAYVTHEYPGIVSEIDLIKRSVLRTFPAGPYARGLSFSPDESKLFVSEFHSGRLLAIDREQGKIVDQWFGQSTDNLARHVVVHPRRPKAYLSHIRSIVNVNSARGSIFPQLSVCDLIPPKPDVDGKIPKRRTSFALDTFNNVYVVTNPWEAALTPDGSRIYTIYAGTDDMNVSQVIDDDYKEIERLGSATTVGKNPRAVRVSPDGKTVYIYNAMDFAVVAYRVEGTQRIGSVTCCDPPKTPAWVRGKILFNSGKQPMTSARWIACSSCHPDGGSDMRTWQNPEGHRKTTGFFGMAHTHPLHWSADRDESQDFEFTIRGQLMQGQGLYRGQIKTKQPFKPTELEEKLSGKSEDLDALAIYCNSFNFTLSPHAPAPGKLSPEADRGRKLFFSKEANCASCHTGPYFTDSTLTKPFKLHNVGTGKEDASEKIGPTYDTPTLLGIYRHSSYLHHGKAKTLHEVLTKFNPNDQHGKTSHLKKEEIEDLVAFLKSLPYELPPDETPNTVKDRVPAKK
jgi:YVTN family beta-propeller protein